MPHSHSILDDAYARINAAASLSGSSHATRRAPPTSAQALAGNYLKPRVGLHGLPLAIEQDRHSVREGEDANGRKWSNRMASIYGEITGTKGADGDPLDVFIGHFPETRAVWIINQQHADGTFDEHKICLGFHSKQAAEDAYLLSFERGWTGLMSIHFCTIGQLKWWIKNGKMHQPFTSASIPLGEGGDE